MTAIHEERRRMLSLIALAGWSLLVLSNPFTHVLLRGFTGSIPNIALRGFLAPLTMALLVGSLAAITRVLHSGADRLGLFGAALTIMGWSAGIRIIGLGQLEQLAANGATPGAADTLQRMFDAAPLVWRSIVPMGILFPIGLITLGLAVALAGSIPRWIGVLFVAGGVLFPVGRIAGIEWAVIASDLCVGFAFALVAWQVYAQPEFWTIRQPAVAGT